MFDVGQRNSGMKIADWLQYIYIFLEFVFEENHTDFNNLNRLVTSQG